MDVNREATMDEATSRMPYRRRIPTVRGRVTTAAAALLLLGAMVAVSRASGDGSSPSLKAEVRSAGMTVGGAADAAAATGVDATPPLPAGIGDPKVVKTAALDLEVRKGRFAGAFDEVASIAAGLGGFVASSTSTAGTGDDGRLGTGTLVVRVPADRFDDARKRLLGLGTLTREELRGDDVGGQLADLDARLRNLHSQEDAIRALMPTAKSVSDTISVQQQLSTVREQIEQLSAQQARLSDAVAMSTITVTLVEPGAVTGPTDPSPLVASLRQAAHGAEAVAGGTIVAAGYLLPLATLFALGWLLSRPFARRRTAVSPGM
jgi:hypothetical protein